jgi:CMP/dCMP kinase
VIVTVSNEYGCGALAIAAEAARALGYRYVDEQLPVVVAKRLRISPEEVDATEDSPRSLGERMMESLERATPELAQITVALPLDDDKVRAVADAVNAYARKGNCVIIGRGAWAILRGREDVVRVFMHAPRAWRVAHLVATTHVSQETAAAEIERIDRARVAYIKQWYGLTFGDARNYDLAMDTARMPPAQCASAIAGAVRDRG